jgi:hypothetical protein
MEGHVVSFLGISYGPQGEVSQERQIHKYASKNPVDFQF